MKKVLCALLVLWLLAGCEPAVLPPPTIVSVMPERIAAWIRENIDYRYGVSEASTGHWEGRAG